MARRTWWKVGALLAAMMVFLTMLPVTALAVDGDTETARPATLVVGKITVNTPQDGYWTTDQDTGALTPCTGGGDDWNVKYESSSNTLTLRGASIQGGSNTVSEPYGSGIYALSRSGQPVSLTIKLIGENTITGFYGIFLNAEMNASSYGTNATLTIIGESNGSLKVSGSYHGIYVKSGTGNASLNIKNVAVTSSTNGDHDAGVYVMSSMHATNSPNISLAVDGGSLTASGTGSSDGILFYVGSSQATGATTSLTVSENAIVDARNGGISALKISETLPTPTPTGDNRRGIVFDGTEGTVYGDVTLDESLTINQGETLTVPQGSSLTSNDKLTNNGTVTIENGGTLTGAEKVTNNGTINVEDGGKLEGTPTGGTVVKAPTITTQPADMTVTEGQTASFTVTATGENPTYQWMQSTDQGESWTEISGATGSTYTTVATTTSMSGYQYRCVVSNSAGDVTSGVATLTVNEPAPTTYTITADVDPVEAGTVTVNGSGTSATVTANTSVTLKATANSGYRFVEWQENGTQVSTNDSYSFNASDNCTLTAKFEKVYTVTVNASGNGTATADKITAAEGKTVTLTASPDSGYRFTGWTSSDGVTFANASSESTTFTMPAGDVAVTAGFTRTSSGSTTPSKTPSQQAVDKIESAKDGSTVEITLRTGQTKLDKEVFEALAGRDVTLEISLTGGVTWTVNGQDIPADADLTDLDMGVSLNTSTIPVNLINSVTGEAGTVQLTLKHNGEFGFTMTLTAPVGVKNAGLWANLYRYDDEAGSLGYEATAQVDGEGVARLPFDHASSWLVALDSRGHALPFSDANDGEWYSEAVRWAWLGGVMTGYGDGSGLFGTSSALTRAEAAVVHWRLAGEPEGASGLPADCDPSGFYAEAASWALGAGVFSGYSGDAFGPADAITREQLATVLWRAAGSPEAGGDLSSFSDAADVSGFADVAMRWAVSAGVLRGQGDGDALDPQGACTRAQLATMLYRLAAAE